MQILRWIFGALVLAAAVASPLRSAFAQNLDLDAVGALLALPILTRASPEGDRITSLTVANASSLPVVLSIQVLSGDPEDLWRSNSFSCVLSGDEVTQFLIFPFGSDGSQAFFECSTPEAHAHSEPAALNLRREEVLLAREGIFFVSLEGLDGTSRSSNVLRGSATVIDFADSSAYQLGAIPFQGGDVLAQDGDHRYRFDGLEYAHFPSFLVTPFHAPTWETVEVELPEGGTELVPQPGLEGSLVLFTLDGSTGGSAPRVSLKVDFWNDDELRRNTDFSFRGFTVVPLEDIDSRFAAPYLGSAVGHLQLTPRVTAVSDLAHDLQFDGPTGDGVRRVPVHGWLVQHLHPGGILRTLDTETPPATGSSAWGRTLAQGAFGLVPSRGDIPTLNTGF
jgi:hypothetical protein